MRDTSENLGKDAGPTSQHPEPAEQPAPEAVSATLAGPAGATAAPPQAGAPAGQAVKRATRGLTEAPPLKLEVYEGPLDLLLDLIRKQELNIYDIPIARITSQYLEYLRACQELNIDLGGEFVFMAATLIYIKSRTLLPPDPDAAGDEMEDPRTELVHRLLEHEQFKNAAQMLQSKLVLEDAMWSEPGIGEFAEAEDEPGLAVSVFDLISAFREILERAKKRTPLEIRREEVSVAEMIERICDVLRHHHGSVSLDELAAGYASRQALVALLLALLELVRLQAVRLKQKGLFEPIAVQRHTNFDHFMAGSSRAALEAALEASMGVEPRAEPPGDSGE